MRKDTNGYDINENKNRRNRDDNVINCLNKEIVYETIDLNLWYGENHALKNIDLDIHENEVTAIIGPSGCGKSPILKH